MSAKLKLSLNTVASLILLVGSIGALASIFLPWWSLNANAVNGQADLFSFEIGPSGFGIKSGICDIPIMLGPMEDLNIIVGIAMLPISISLFFGFFNGVYCLARKRHTIRVFVGPLWDVIGLFWWFFYWFALYSLFKSAGLDIPPTGSYDISWAGYQLVGVSWGWSTGLYLALVSIVLMFVASFLIVYSSKKAELIQGAPSSEVKKVLGFHSIGLILIAVLNLLAALLAMYVSNFGSLIFIPTILLFVMAFLARSEKAKPVATFPPVMFSPITALSTQQPLFIVPSPIPAAVIGVPCPFCNTPVTWVPEYSKWYCHRCSKYPWN